MRKAGCLVTRAEIEEIRGVNCEAVLESLEEKGLIEETGRLEDLLLKVGSTFEADTRRTVKRLIALAEPAIILVMGLVVGFIVVAMLMAILSVTDIPI